MGTWCCTATRAGAPDPIAPGSLVSGSLFLTRPGLPAYTRTRDELLARSSDVFGWIADGKLRVRDRPPVSAGAGRHGAAGPRGAPHHGEAAAGRGGGLTGAVRAVPDRDALGKDGAGPAGRAVPLRSRTGWCRRSRRSRTGSGSRRRRDAVDVPPRKTPTLGPPAPPPPPPPCLRRAPPVPPGPPAPKPNSTLVPPSPPAPPSPPGAAHAAGSAGPAVPGRERAVGDRDRRVPQVDGERAAAGLRRRRRRGRPRRRPRRRRRHRRDTTVGEHGAHPRRAAAAAAAPAAGAAVAARCAPDEPRPRRARRVEPVGAAESRAPGVTRDAREPGAAGAVPPPSPGPNDPAAPPEPPGARMPDGPPPAPPPAPVAPLQVPPAPPAPPGYPGLGHAQSAGRSDGARGARVALPAMVPVPPAPRSAARGRRDAVLARPSPPRRRTRRRRVIVTFSSRTCDPLTARSPYTDGSAPVRVVGTSPKRQQLQRDVGRAVGERRLRRTRDDGRVAAGAKLPSVAHVPAVHADVRNAAAARCPRRSGRRRPARPASGRRTRRSRSRR